MKLKSLKVLVAVGALFLTADAIANPLDFYFDANLSGGFAMVFSGTNAKTLKEKNTATDFSQAFGAAVGIDVSPLRIETEYNFINDDDIKYHMGMLNLYTKLPSVRIHPYLGLGVGGVFGGNTNLPNTKIKTRVAYQGMAGLTFDTPKLPVDFDVELRVAYVPNIYEFLDRKADALHYDLRLKVRYTF